MRICLMCCALAATSITAPAQWLNYPAPGVPRNPDGTVNMSAPAPRLPNGTSDLSGVWIPASGPKYGVNLAADLDPTDVPFRPPAADLFRERSRTGGKDSPTGHCLAGVPEVDVGPYPFRILQSRGLVVMLYEVFTKFRQIFTDGRSLPQDPNPTWFGYSIGHWDSGTLVVETSGVNGRSWLDLRGHPETDQARIVERFTRRDFGHIQVETTIDDPGAYTRPWQVSYELMLLPDTEPLEMICNENNTTVDHLVGE